MNEIMEPHLSETKIFHFHGISIFLAGVLCVELGEDKD